MDEVGLAGPVPNPRWWWQSLTANELINVAHSSCAVSGFPMKNYDGRKYSTLEATGHSSRIGILTKRRPCPPTSVHPERPARAKRRPRQEAGERLALVTSLSYRYARNMSSILDIKV
jgi:hypothetical protein